MANRGLRANGLGVAVFLAVYVSLLWGIRVGQLYAFGDLPPYYGAAAIEKFVSTWHHHQLGYAYQYNVIPVYLGVLTAVGGALAQNLFYLSLIPVGYLGFLVFLRRFVDSTPARHLSAGLYAINPLTIGEFSNGDVVALVGFAGLPFVLHYLHRVVEEDSWVSALKAAMVFGATTVVPWLGFWMVAPFATILAYRARTAPRTLAKLFAAGVAGVALALPGVYNMVQRALGLESSTGRELLFDSLRWNYAEASPLALLRLAGNHGDRTMTTLGYNGDPLLVLVGLVVPGIALLALPRRDLRPYGYVVVAVVAFAAATRSGLTYPLFDRFPPLLSARNPSKLMYPLLVSLSLLFGAGIETVTAPRAASGNRLGAIARQKRSDYDRRAVVTVLLLLLLLLTYAAPAAGAYGIREVRGEDYVVPKEQYALADSLDGRVLMVPYTYTTQLQLRRTFPDHVGIKSGGVYHGIQADEYVADVFETFATRPDAARPSLSTLGVRYVVVDLEPPGPESSTGSGPTRLVEKWGAPWLAGDPAAYEERLERSTGYTEAFRTDRYVVYRVEAAEAPDRYETFDGLHAVAYAREASVEVLGENRLANPSFVNGTDHWWTPPEMSTREVNTDGGNALLLEPEDPASARAVAQTVAVRDRYPYRVSVDATGRAGVHLFWYDDEQSVENLVEHEVYDVHELPAVVHAKGDVLSFRVRPNATRVEISETSVVRTTYPARTGFSAGAADVPGVAVDAYADPPAGATLVAANGGGRDVEAAVQVVDAETVLDGELVFDPAYRQGVAVVPAESEQPPEDARVVTRESPAGTAIDYWVVGTFDDDPVTVLRTAYDEDWTGPPGSTHFRAYGWANGFTDASPEEIHWQGGDGLRLAVLRLWAGLWILALGALVVLHGRRLGRRVLAHRRFNTPITFRSRGRDHPDFDE